MTHSECCNIDNQCQQRTVDRVEEMPYKINWLCWDNMWLWEPLEMVFQEDNHEEKYWNLGEKTTKKTKVKTDPIAWGICDFESDLRWWLEKGCLPLKILFSTPSQQDLMEHVSPLKYVPSFTSFVTDDSGEVWVLALFQHHRWPFICFLKGLHDNSTINDFQNNSSRH